MMKKGLFVFLTAVLILGVLPGLYPGGSSQPKGNAITLYGNADDLAKPYMKTAFAAWEAKTGNKIDIQGIDASNAESILLTKFTTGDIPDVFLHFGNYHLLNFRVEANFYDFSNAPWVRDVVDSVLPQAKVNGKVYGLPFWEASVSGMFYNKKIFAQYGLTPPKTHAEFEALCEKLLAAGVQPIFLPTADSWPILYQFAFDPIFDSPQGEQLLAKLNSNEIKYADIPQIKTIAEFFKRAADKGYFGKNFMTDRWDHMSEVLGNGEAAMVYCWDTWFDTDYDNDSYPYKKGDFGLMPAYMGTPENGTFEGPNVNLLMVNKNSPRAAIALDLIDFMSKPENYNKAFNGIATTPVFKGQTTNKPSSQYQEVKDWVSRVGHASVAQPRIVGYSQVQGGKILQALMGGGITEDECIQQLDDDRINTLKSFSK
ncbi:MAG: ABC transporter substrate-binding protein [Spirochaetaceae bacterium]|jgi:ABC-type glycerol-3-phosphate transport system substrate-binding protein|nr:ABC transporter substrate-binding protein [Spirochaetaceae bacterium]